MTAKHRTRVLYISPLKALGVDVERNLRSPLVGVTQTAKRLGMPAPEVTVGVRSGDTTPEDRRGLARTPPDILITTPESLYLMLTSAARETLLGVETVIVDEVHAVAASKRGAHLALSLERLDALLPEACAADRALGDRAAARRGRPVPRRARAGDDRAAAGREDVRPAGRRAGGGHGGAGMIAATADSRGEPGISADATGSIWPHVEEAIVDLHPGAPVDDRVRELAPAGRAADRAAE